jgi:hypothetical protein
MLSKITIFYRFFLLIVKSENEFKRTSSEVKDTISAVAALYPRRKDPGNRIEDTPEKVEDTWRPGNYARMTVARHIGI